MKNFNLYVQHINIVQNRTRKLTKVRVKDKKKEKMQVKKQQ